MKKKIFAGMLLTFILLLAIGCADGQGKVNQDSTEWEKNDQLIQAWLVEHLQSSDKCKLNVGLLTVYDEWAKEKPADIPLSVTAEFVVYIDKQKMQAMIETIAFGQDPVWEQQTIYLSVVGDKVNLSRLTKDGLKNDSSQAAGLAEAVSALFFPKDPGILEGEVLHSVITDDSPDNLKTVGVQRSVDSKPFYRPYFLWAKEQQVEKDPLSLSFAYALEAKKMHSLTIHNVEDYIKTVSFLLSGQEYENVYLKHGLNYDQELTIYFSNIDQDFVINLPGS